MMILSQISQNTRTRQFTVQCHFRFTLRSVQASVNMALRTSEQDESQSKSSPIPGLPYFWPEAEKQRKTD